MEVNSELADFIRAKMKEKNLSTYDVARKSGNRISATAISKILSGDVAASSVKTLSHIAAGLGIRDQDIFQVAAGKGDRPLHFQIYAERFDAEDISDSEWQFIETNINDYVEKFRLFKQEMRERHTMPAEPLTGRVVARIEPGKQTEPMKSGKLKNG